MLKIKSDFGEVDVVTILQMIQEHVVTIDEARSLLLCEED